MKTKTRSREIDFVSMPSRKREAGVTFQFVVAQNPEELEQMGARIRELRAARRLKQQTIADYCGVRLRTYQHWQAGNHPPEEEHLNKLAELFGVTPKFIMRGPTPDPITGPGSGVDELLAEVKSLTQAIEELLRRGPQTEPPS